jgi:outer membrane receptor protein involved in Fe transport
MTNPSARYDAQGAGGVINIVLKKQQKPGLNGRAAVNLGTRGKYNTSLSLNRRQGKANFFLAYDWRHDEIQVKHRRDQRISSGNEVIRNRQLTSYGQTAENHAPRVGLDYDFTPTQSLTLSVQPRLNSYQALGRLDTDISNETSGQDLGPLSGPTATRTRSRTVEVLLDYRRTWAEQKGRELSANLVLTPVGWGRSFMEQRYNEGQPGQLVRQQRGYFNFIMGTTQLDYVHPLSPQTRLEAGVKAVLFDTDEGNDFAALPFDGREFVPAPALTRSFRYREQVQAGYGIWRTEAGKLTAQAGLRAEQTNTRGRLTAGQPELNGQEFVRSYFNLFPSATIAYALPAEQRLQLSYSRRINRPSIDAQLPFVEYDNPLSTRVGNPTLLPELSNVLELGHQWQKGAASLGTTAFFRETNQRIQLLRRVLDTTTTVNGQRLPVSNTTFANIGRSTTYGLEVSFNHTLAKWWRLSANTSAFRSLISGDESREIANQAFVYTARLNTTFTPVPKLDVQLTGTYRSPSVSNQGRIAEQYFLDLALKKDVLKDRGSITLRVSDIFDTNQTGVVLTAPDVSMDILLKRESRIAFLGFSYRFGQQDQAPRRPRRNADSSSGGGTDVGG